MPSKSRNTTSDPHIKLEKKIPEPDPKKEDKTLDTKAEKTTDSEMEERKAEESQIYRFGWFSLTPKWLQGLNTAFWYMVWLTLANTFLSGTVNGLSGSVQSSLETRFELSSSSSSWVMASYEIGTIPLLLVTSYLGSRGLHRPRWLAWGMAASVLGSALYALPHFTTPVYDPAGLEGEDRGLCANRTGVDGCAERRAGGSLSQYLGVFILARLVMGASSVTQNLLGMTFLDDCLPSSKFTLYSAIYAAGGVIGPAIGFIAGGALLGLFTDWMSVDAEGSGVGPEDPRWVGAWWVGFVAAALFMLITTLPLSGYPIDLPGASLVRANKTSEAFNAEEDAIPSDVTKVDFGAKDIPRYLKDIFTNWSFVGIAIFICCDMAIISGFAAFGPKYLEVQFSQTPAMAGVLFGALVVPAGAIGTILAGVIVDKFQMSAAQMMKLEAGIGVVVLLMGSCLLITCDQADFAGVNRDYGDGGDVGNRTTGCNLDCMCENVPFSPICSTDNVQFYSPCHAGCTEVTDSMEYYNCSCTNSTSPSEKAAIDSICSNPSCTLVPLFGVMIFVAMMGLFMAEAMNISLVIRVVPNTHRLFAMMVQSIILRLLGTIPGPLIFGQAFDVSCLLWQDKCGQQGSCFYYDNSKLSLMLFTVCVCVKLISIISMFFAWRLYKPPKTDSSEEQDKGSDNRAFSVATDAVKPQTEEKRAQSNGDVVHNDKPQLQRGISEEDVKKFFDGSGADQVGFDLDDLDQVKTQKTTL